MRYLTLPFARRSKSRAVEPLALSIFTGIVQIARPPVAAASTSAEPKRARKNIRAYHAMRGEKIYSLKVIRKICMSRNVVIGAVVVAVLGAGGWWYLNQSIPTPASSKSKNVLGINTVPQQPTTYTPPRPTQQQSSPPTLTAPQKALTITSPANGTKIDPYADFTVRWQVNAALINETVGVYVSGPGGTFTCLPGQSGNRPSDYECTEALVAEVPASSGAYVFNINSGCLFEMPVQVRIATKSGAASDSVGPIILQGGACGRSYE